MGCAGREVHEERLVRHERLLLADPADGMVGEVFGEVVALLRGLRRLDRGEALIEGGVPLVVLAADEAIEVFEPAAPGRPVVERAHRARLPDRDLVTLSELRRGIAVQLEGLGQWRHRVRPQGRISGSRRRDLGDAAHAGRVMVATGQQGLSGRRAERRGVEPRVLDRVGRDRIEVRRVAWTAERARCSEADVVDQDDQDVRGALGRPDRLDRRELRRRGSWRRTGSAPAYALIRDRQDVAVAAVGSLRHGASPPGGTEWSDIGEADSSATSAANPDQRSSDS